MSVTQNLSNLRLTYARLLEDHGANTALLRTREAEIAELEAQVQEGQQTIEKLLRELNLVKEKAERLDNRAQLADRDVGFLKAMVVSMFPVRHTAMY